MRTTMIKLGDDSYQGTANGRPVKFSQSLWAWYYTDTAPGEPVEQVENPQTYREGTMADRLEAARWRKRKKLAK